MARKINGLDPVNKDAYSADIASIANGATYSTTTYIQEMDIDGADFIDIKMKCTVPDAAISGGLTFYWFLTNDNTDYPSVATFTSQMTPVQNTTTKENHTYDVRGYKYLKVQKVVNSSGQTLTAVNAQVTSR